MSDEYIWNNEHTQIARSFGVKEFGERLASAMKREPKEQKKKSFAPSSFYKYGNGVCPRYWWYAFHGATFEYNDTDAMSQQNMDQGTDAGVRIANLLDKAGLLVEAEAKAINEDPPIFGYIDALVDWKGKVIPAEVKTTKTETWTQRAVDNKVPTYQLIQLLIYMYVRGDDRGFFITENKNDNRLFILPIAMTDEYKALVEKLFEWLRKVKDNIDNGELPIRPFTKSSFNCKGCPVKRICWNEDDGVNFHKGSKNDPAPGTVSIEPLVLE